MPLIPLLSLLKLMAFVPDTLNGAEVKQERKERRRSDELRRPGIFIGFQQVKRS